ncbi:MAG: 30S ribosomal protein S13 [bacterium]|nr:30S ribosomal protein S13 [Candidatus Margulisiibacteriota bacterium]
MARIAGVDLPLNKNVAVGLTYIFGIGPSLSRKLLAAAGVDQTKKVKDLSDTEVIAIRDEIKKIDVEGDLRKNITGNIKRLIDSGSYRGSRHRKNLPVRGQRTKTNSRTKRGKRMTVGSGRKKEEKK